ncbi:MAG: hypothetical protein MI784_02030 [Cytophagales bacterium]|nr:hypothetical protein [Cytophagales bacterium]
MFQKPTYQLHNRVERKRTGKSVNPPALIQAMLSRKVYRRLLGQKTGNTPATCRLSRKEQQIESLLEQYEFLTAEKLNLSRRKSQLKDNYKENIYSRLACLHQLEQLAFEWKRTHEISEEQLKTGCSDSDFRINAWLLGEIQKERTILTQEHLDAQIPFMPSIRYGFSSPPSHPYWPGYEQFLKLPESPSDIFDIDTSSCSESETLSVKGLLLSFMNQLTALPTGQKIVSEFTQLATTESVPSLKLIPFYKEDPAPFFGIDPKTTQIQITTGWTPEDFMLPVRAISRSGLFQKTVTKQSQDSTFAIPSLFLGAMLNKAMCLKRRMKEDKAEKMYFQDLALLYNEAKLPAPTHAQFIRTNSSLSEAPQEEDFTSGSGLFSALSLEPGAAAAELRPKTFFVPSHGLLRPSEAFFGKEQATMSLLQPSLDFNPETMDFSSIRKLGTQGKYSNVYEFNLSNGKPLIIKFVKPIGDYLHSFSWHPEKEAFASNFIRSFARRIDAPETLALAQNDPRLEKIRVGIQKRPPFANKKEFLSNLRMAQLTSCSHPCLIMEKMSGRSILELISIHGKEQQNRLLYLLMSPPNVLAAIGELYLYDLLLGNFDRLWEGVHGGNLLFTANFSYDLFGQLVAREHEQSLPLQAIDQSLSLYGQYIFLKRLKNGSRPSKDDLSYSRMGHYVEESEKFSTKLHQNTHHMLEYLESLLKNVLDNLMRGKLGHSLPLNFLSNFIFDLSLAPLELGIVEGMLKLQSKQPMLEAFSKMRFPNFATDARYFFECCQRVLALLSRYDQQQLIIRFSEEKSKIKELS